MAGILLSGPAGGAKSQEARAILADHPGPAVAADFQAIVVALTLAERGADGLYPVRPEFVLPTAEYLRRATITAAEQRNIYVVATNSDGDPGRRRALLTSLGSGARERIIDPGPLVVAGRLNVSLELLEDGGGPCGDAIRRWYGRLPQAERPQLVDRGGGLTPNVPHRPAKPVQALIGVPTGPRPFSELGTPRG